MAPRRNLSRPFGPKKSLKFGIPSPDGLNLRRTGSHQKKDMAEILPFRALRFNPETVGKLESVVTQPYDKISPEMQARYYAASQFNIVRVIRSREEPGDSAKNNVYTRAAETLGGWIRNRALVSEAEPALYRYDQEFREPQDARAIMRRRGFIALGRLEDYSAGIVFPHEETLSGPKADRLELLKATHAHFGQIFVLYSDPEGAIEATLESYSPATERPWERATDEYGTVHTVWRVQNGSAIESIVEKMRSKKLVIADGHHRYETALAFRDFGRSRLGDDPRADYAMMTFVRMETDGLTILPTHRVLHSLRDFDWKGTLAGAQEFFEWTLAAREGGDWRGRFLTTLSELGRARPALGVYAGSERLGWLALKPAIPLARLLPDLPSALARLDTVLLHRLLIERVLGISREAVREEKNLRYIREPDLAFEEVDRGRAHMAFLMNPTPVREVWGNALAGHVLPQKSTDFYPKLLSGLTAYWLDNPAGI